MGGMLTIAEVAADLDAVISRVQAGEEIVVVRDGSPVARLSRVPPKGAAVFGDLAARHDWSRFDLSPEALGLPEEDWEEWAREWGADAPARPA